MPLTTGQSFASDYELLRPLGTGGMGEVWLARERPLGRDVALKAMRESDGPARSARFAREARALAALDHPSILPVLRAGTDPATRRPFLVTRAVLLSPPEIRRLCREILRCPLPHADPDSRGEGAPAADPASVTLADLLENGKALPQEAVLRLARDLAAALGAAHGAGILHRDVKPSNILYDASGRALLADFGLAKFLPQDRPSGRAPSGPEGGAGETPATISLDGEGRAKFLGSPAYAAPEQFDPAAGPPTPALDWYSFGAVVYRALTGHRPGSPRKPSSFDPRHVSGAWNSLLAALLEPDPARRLADAGEVARRLDRIERAIRHPVRVDVFARFITLCFVAGFLATAAVLIVSGRDSQARSAVSAEGAPATDSREESEKSAEGAPAADSRAEREKRTPVAVSGFYGLVSDSDGGTAVDPPPPVSLPADSPGGAAQTLALGSDSGRLRLFWCPPDASNGEPGFWILSNPVSQRLAADILRLSGAGDVRPENDAYAEWPVFATADGARALLRDLDRLSGLADGGFRFALPTRRQLARAEEELPPGAVSLLPDDVWTADLAAAADQMPTGGFLQQPLHPVVLAP